jgi:tRNA modification GTPase
MFNIDDTIVAISSAPGPAARGVIRLSGPDAVSLAEQCFKTEDYQSAPSAGNPAKKSSAMKRRRYFGSCTLAEAATCPAELLLFFAPHSYTCQDTAELHLPGSPPLLRMVVQNLIQRGARPAGPGEFTARAFFNGRIDLSQAEAVAEVISARSDAQLRAAQKLLDGALHKFCREIQSESAELLALVEAQIDFSQDDIELISPTQLNLQLSRIRQKLFRLITESVSWEQLDHLPQVMLAGPANTGKSSLANALLCIDRSIVSSIAGTTRDQLTAPLKLTTGECLLIDTAGLGPVDDPLADQTQRLSLERMPKSDLILYVIDSCKNDAEILADLAYLDQLGNKAAVIIIANKIDLLADPMPRLDQLAHLVHYPFIAVSAIRGENIKSVKSSIERHLQDIPAGCSAEAIALTTRQRQALADAVESITQADQISRQTRSDQTEIVAFYLREAIDHLGGISGQIVPDDILGMIFSRFCIGK